MNNSLSASYPYKRIAKISSLEAELGTNISALKAIASNINSFYKENPPNDKGRITHSVLEPLKSVQKKIKNAFLDKVSYPSYLHAYKKNHSHITNAQSHLNKNMLINEDISKFFDNCNSGLIFNIWRYFFNFSTEVAALLTQLTILNDRLPQGAGTSPSLSNLIFWKDEPILAEALTTLNLAYTRYGDDITVSSNNNLTSNNKTKIIGLIYKMLFKNGFNPNRKKHRIYNSSQRMCVNGQTVNTSRATLSKTYLNNVRAAIHNLKKIKNNLTQEDFKNKHERIRGRINYIQRYNCKKALGLKIKLEELSREAEL